MRGLGQACGAWCCRVFACGDGFVDGAEECDDGDVVTGDGCSDACAIEMGYGCTGAPSTCVALDANAYCASATAITADTTITGDDMAYLRERGLGLGRAYQQAMASDIEVHGIPAGAWFGDREIVLTVTGPSALASFIEAQVIWLLLFVPVWIAE